VAHIPWWEIETRERTALGGADRWFAIVRDPSGISFGLWTPNGVEDPGF
jgi:hypothetical protein